MKPLKLNEKILSEYIYKRKPQGFNPVMKWRMEELINLSWIKVRNSLKCKKDNPADYLYCQYCGEKLI